MQIEALGRVIRNCQEVDRRRVLKRVWLMDLGPTCQRADILVETILPPGKKRDLLTAELLKGVEEQVAVHFQEAGSQTSRSLIWRSRR